MKFKGTLIGEASGSLNGITFSHNRFGQYIRVRNIPVNPGSQRQQVVRGIMTTLTTRWSQTLTPALREQWETYAQNTPRTDKLGAAQILTGLNWYVAMNVVRMLSLGVVVDAAPTTYGMASATIPTIVSATAATEILSIGFTNTDSWAGEVGGKLLVFISRPMNSSHMFFKGPFAYAGAIAGAVVPPTSPLPITSPFPFAVGNRIWAQFRAIRADGRISGLFQLTSLGI